MFYFIQIKFLRLHLSIAENGPLKITLKKDCASLLYNICGTDYIIDRPHNTVDYIIYKIINIGI